MRKALHLERDVHLGEEGADGKNDWLVVELKCRDSLPQWMKEGYAQAVLRASKEQLPILVLHEKGSPHRFDYVFMCRQDFEDWFGRAEAALALAEAEKEGERRAKVELVAAYEEMLDGVAISNERAKAVAQRIVELEAP